MPIVTRHYKDGKLVEATLVVANKDGGGAKSIDIPIGDARPTFEKKASTWPLECFASGVHPNQAAELAGHLRACGVPTEISRDGNPIYTSLQHRRKALKARGMFDRNSYI